MVEGGMIDKAHHQNWAKKAFEETLELEKAVKMTLKLTNEEETLVVVTADHSHSITMSGYPKRGNNILGYVYNKERQLWSNPSAGMYNAWSTISYANGLGFRDHFTNNSTSPWKDIWDMDYNDDQYRSPAMLPTFDRKETHGGEDVPVLAQGPWAHLFVGVHEESYFCQAVEHAAGWGGSTKKKQLSNNQATSLPYNIIVLTFLACWSCNVIITAISLS